MNRLTTQSCSVHPVLCITETKSTLLVCIKKLFKCHPFANKKALQKLEATKISNVYAGKLATITNDFATLCLWLVGQLHYEDENSYKNIQ
ncbi:uncharacterized protein PRCAT00001196001 [Priceomyces carsonii]|uniref:uncharacterized protein n=1 Tax=Priceomyces carsonii TaxID=28549 RepID=UPI002EDBA06C|nr:unnamed protein product [Priceomyces carsonii]